MDRFTDLIKKIISWFSLPTFELNNIIEILIITFVVYQIAKWVKNTRAWTLFKGIAVILVFALLAYLFDLTIILWIFTNTFNVIVISVFILFQPELRRALEQLGRKNIIAALIGPGSDTEKTDKTIERRNVEIVKAVSDLSKAKTGALIVIEREVKLSEYERTGITMDAILSSQLLINIFEHNTPLHDGAVFVRDGRIVAATCYLPLTDNMLLSKSLGTRHRAAVGISEVSDSLTIVVSEETGHISVAQDGRLSQGINLDELKERLTKTHKRQEAGKLRKLKGIIKNEKKDNK